MSASAYGCIYVGVECGEKEKSLLRTPIKNIRVCPNGCDTSNSPGKFCTDCGKELKQETIWDYSDKFIEYAEDQKETTAEELWKMWGDAWDNYCIGFKELKSESSSKYILGFSIREMSSWDDMAPNAIALSEVQAHISNMNRIAKAIGLPEEAKLYLSVSMC